MKTELAQKLKEVLDNMSQEQFDQEWAEVTSLNLEGPSFGDFVEYISDIQTPTGQYVVAQEVIPSSYSAGENNYALAA